MRWKLTSTVSAIASLRRRVGDGVEHLAQRGHVFHVHRGVRADERHAAVVFEQQRIADRRSERAAVDRGDHFERVQHAQHGARVAPVGRPVVEAVQGQVVERRLIGRDLRRADAHHLEVVRDPLLVPRLLVHVLVQKVAHLPELIRHAAGRGCAGGIEMPDDVVKLEQQLAVALDRHAVRDGIEDHGVGFEIATRFIGAHYQVAKERQHQFFLRAKQLFWPSAKLERDTFDGGRMQFYPQCRSGRMLNMSTRRDGLDLIDT